MNNVNTKSYWDNRFSSGDWENKSGRLQTRKFALSQIKHLDISKDFNGSILDFGCGLGDAFPVYKKNFPKARLIGLDISEGAIDKCKKLYGHLGKFICGTFDDVPVVDIIISSNVFEHLSDDIKIAKNLLSRCNQLYIIVPYNEMDHDNPQHEHVNYNYNEFYFRNVTKNITYKIYYSKGWGKEGIDLYYNIYFKNIARFFLGKNLVKRLKQIMFKLHK